MAYEHSVLFFVQLTDLANRARIVDLLRSLPGVGEVTFPGSAEAGPALEGEVRVSYDGDQTNAITLERALADQGITVLSAREEPPGP